MSFRYSAVRIHEIVQAEKCLASDHTVDPKKRGDKGLGFEAFLDLVDGPFTDLIFRGKAGVHTLPETYDSGLFLNQERIRGIGFTPLPRKNLRRKLRIDPGWHQNIVDPNLPTNHPANNRHEPLRDFSPTDFEDFTRKSARLWNIDLGWTESLV